MSIKDLFRITEGTAVYRFTSSNEVAYIGLEEFPPRVVGRDDFKDTANFLKDTVNITFPMMDDLAQHFLQSSIDYKARIEAYSLNTETGELTTEWRGTLKDVKPDGKKIKLEFNSLFASNRTAGARPVFQRTCRHTLYSLQCGVSFDDFKVEATVTDVSSNGLTLTVPEVAVLPDGYLNAGVIKFPDGTMRAIRSHVGSSLTIVRFSPSLYEAIEAYDPDPVPVEVAPGCFQNMARCLGTFGNNYQYGGFLGIPLKNPNGSSIV